MSDNLMFAAVLCVVSSAVFREVYKGQLEVIITNYADKGYFVCAICG